MRAKASKPGPSVSRPVGLSNAEIANRLSALAQLLSAQGANPYKIRAYRRAAETIHTLGESVDELVRTGADLTVYPGIGNAIAGALREIVESGTLRTLETLRTEVKPELAELGDYPRLNPRLVRRVYAKLGLSSIAALKEKLASGEVTSVFGTSIAHQLQQALTESNEMLLYDADPLAEAVAEFLVSKCDVERVEAAGDYRRRVEVIGELVFLIETNDFPAVVAKMERYGGRTDLVSANEERATFKLSSGVRLTLAAGTPRRWGVQLIQATGSATHLKKLPGLSALARTRATFATEAAVYRKLGLRFIEPELREGRDEIELAAKSRLPELVTLEDIRGELHCHTTSSDGAHTIEQMAAAAQQRGLDYIGIADHSQSLKIAGGVSAADLRVQLRAIDRLNEKLRGIRVLKSAEVDILADGSLDYPDELLAELDYTVCSIHSRFGLGKQEQTERILRAMDNPHFNILGHATGRLLLKRPGYEIDFERVLAHAKQRGCCFEINASPDRLDLSVAHARLAHAAGIKIAINTDAHSIHELDFLRCGIDQARRAGLAKADVLNCLSWPELRRVLR